MNYTATREKSRARSEKQIRESAPRRVLDRRAAALPHATAARFRVLSRRVRVVSQLILGQSLSRAEDMVVTKVMKGFLRYLWKYSCVFQIVKKVATGGLVWLSCGEWSYIKVVIFNPFRAWLK
jgi:hypothetical protein